MRKRRPEGLKFSHPPQPFSIPIFAVWGAFFPPRFVELRHLAQRRRDAKAGTGLARPDLNKLQLGCQQRLTNAELERWASSPFISLINSGMKIACVFSALLRKFDLGERSNLGDLDLGSRRELSNAYSHAKFGFGTAKNEPSTVWPIAAEFQ